MNKKRIKVSMGLPSNPSPPRPSRGAQGEGRGVMDNLNPKEVSDFRDSDFRERAADAIARCTDVDLLEAMVVIKRLYEESQAALELAQKERQWQPIETAPKDVEVLVLHEILGVIQAVKRSEMVGISPGSLFPWQSPVSPDNWLYTKQVTHWMPLPEPPKEADRG